MEEFMRGNKNFKSKQFIEEAYVALLLQKDFKKITVIDIIEQGEVSRATFYKNYEDKYDLSKDFIEEIFLKYKEVRLDKKTDDKDYLIFLNKNRLNFTAIFKIKDELIDGMNELKKLIQAEYKKINNSTDLEADFYASQSVWALNYLASLNRSISEADLNSIHLSFRKLSSDIKENDILPKCWQQQLFIDGL